MSLPPPGRRPAIGSAGPARARSCRAAARGAVRTNMELGLAGRRALVTGAGKGGPGRRGGGGAGRQAGERGPAGWGVAPTLSRAPRRHRAQHGPGAALGGCTGGGSEPNPGRPGQPGPRGRGRPAPAQGAAGTTGRALGLLRTLSPDERPSSRETGDAPPGLRKRQQWLLCGPGARGALAQSGSGLAGAGPGSGSKALSCPVAQRPLSTTSPLPSSLGFLA